MLNNQNIKIRILAYSFILPLVLIGSLAILFTYTELRSLKIVSGISFVSTVLITLFQRYFSEDKFLSTAVINNDKLVLTYFNSLTEKDQLTVRNIAIENVIIKKKKFLFRSLNTVIIKAKNKSIRFFVFDAELDTIESTITFFRIRKPINRELSLSASLKELIDAIALKHANDGITLNPPASISDITEFEKKIGFSLPDDFREFYLICNGFGCNEDIFNIVSLAEADHGKNWFCFSEYMIYSDSWELRFTESEEYEIVSSAPEVILTSSLKEFLLHFLNGGVFNTGGLYEWQEELRIN